MGEQGLDAIVARAPDNVLYLTNFWGAIRVNPRLAARKAAGG